MFRPARLWGKIAARMEIMKLARKSGSKMIRSRKSFGRLSSPSMHSDTVLPSGMMGSVVLLGVCALSVREGWWTVLIEGLQLRRGGETALSDGEVLLYGFK